MLNGTFTPTARAKDLSTALHFNNPSTPITLRFSKPPGLPQVSDASPDANPRGLGIRFNLGKHMHIDIVAHSTSLSPARTGAGFLRVVGSTSRITAGNAVFNAGRKVSRRYCCRSSICAGTEAGTIERLSCGQCSILRQWAKQRYLLSLPNSSSRWRRATR